MKLFRKLLDLFYDEHGITPVFVLGAMAFLAGAAIAWGFFR